jgi:hypothetical protein
MLASQSANLKKLNNYFCKRPLITFRLLCPGTVTLNPVAVSTHANASITDSCRHPRGGSYWAHLCACLN